MAGIIVLIIMIVVLWRMLKKPITEEPVVKEVLAKTNEAMTQLEAMTETAITKIKEEMIPVNEMKFAILGPSGAGKTTLLACMAKEFERVSPGTILPADESAFGTLTNAYKSLMRDANNSATRQFERSIEGTSMLREFLGGSSFKY